MRRLILSIRAPDDGQHGRGRTSPICADRGASRLTFDVGRVSWPSTTRRGLRPASSTTSLRRRPSDDSWCGWSTWRSRSHPLASNVRAAYAESGLRGPPPESANGMTFVISGRFESSASRHGSRSSAREWSGGLIADDRRRSNHYDIHHQSAPAPSFGISRHVEFKLYMSRTCMPAELYGRSLRSRYLK